MNKTCLATGRKSVRRAACGCAILLLAFAAAAAPPPEKPLGLWDRAVQLCRQVVVPTHAVFKTQVTNGKGKILSRAEFTYRIEIEKGRPKLLVVKAIEDGKNVTEEYRAAEKKRPGKKHKRGHETTINLSPWYTPFSPSAQGRTHVTPAGKTVLGKRQAALYRFEQTDASGAHALVGSAWLDASTGLPIKVEVHPVSLPRHVDSLDTTIWYEKGPGETLSPVRTLIEGGGGFLWIHRKVITRIESSGFRLLKRAGP
ncbi:MAG: hypothetical protein P8Z49_07095 [Acidobacteriota bacterium]